MNDAPLQIQENLEEFCKFYDSLGVVQQRIFWILHHASVSYKECFPSLQNMGKRAKCSIWYVSRTISMFCKNNIVEKQRRQRQTNVYSLHNLLKKPDLNRVVLDHKNRESIKEIPIESKSNNKSKHSRKPLPVEAPDAKKTGLYNICNIRIRNTNTPIQEKKPFGKIKEVFQDMSFPEKDKIAFSRYSDQEIDTAMELYGLELEKGYQMLSKVKVFQWCLGRARKGELPPPTSADPPPVHPLLEELNISELDKKRFSQYAESAIIEALYRFDWYNKKQRIEKPGAYLQAVFDDKNKRVVQGHKEQTDRGKLT